MNQFDSTIWENLENKNAIGENYNAQLAFPNLHDWLYCAVDSDKNRHLLIKISDHEDDLIDGRSRGLKVNTVKLEGLSDGGSRFYDFICIEKAGHSVLDVMAEEIVELREQSEEMYSIVSKMLAKWRFFWSQENIVLLSKEEQIGLFAELWFFVKWLYPNYGQDAIINWKGPWKCKNDFEFLNCSIEVKGTTNSRGRIHTINGLDQLSTPENLNLYLFSLQIIEENGASYSLKSLIEECKNLLSGNYEAINHFEVGINLVGYSPAFENEYDKSTYRLDNGLVYSVKDDFPRITKKNITIDELKGIEKVNYEINLNSYYHLISVDSEIRLSNLGIVL